jgi:hypothetical protein
MSSGICPSYGDDGSGALLVSRAADVTMGRTRATTFGCLPAPPNQAPVLITVVHVLVFDDDDFILEADAGDRRAAASVRPWRW